MDLQDKKAVICMLARDCAVQIGRSIGRIEQLQKYFKYCPIIVVENNSMDNTKQVLDNWCTNNQLLTVINCDGLFSANEDKRIGSYYLSTSINRMCRMTTCRNIYLKTIKKKNLSPDFIIIIDIDICDFNPENIIAAIDNAPLDWGAIFANGVVKDRFLFFNIDRYYDLYALNLTGTEIGRTFYDVFIKNKNVENKIKRNPYCKVYSAFSGIGIYKYDLINDIEYIVVPNPISKYIECNVDHTSINYGLTQKNANLYIARDMVVIYDYNKINIIEFIKHLLPVSIVKILYMIFLHINE
jgi:hypothetical protein